MSRQMLPGNWIPLEADEDERDLHQRDAALSAFIVGHCSPDCRLGTRVSLPKQMRLV